MNFTPELVDLIVARVVQQLGTTGAAVPAQPSPQPRLPAAPVDPVAPGIRIAEQVITHDLLADAAVGAGTVRITAQAILTPSARDFIKRHGITLVRESLTPGISTVARWQAIVTKSTPQIVGAVEGLSAIGVACELRLSGLPAEAAAQATSALCRGEAQQVVVFTEQPELLTCLANRNDRVRAAAAADSKSVDRVRQHLQANLLALDPANKSVHELKAILKAFRLV